MRACAGVQDVSTAIIGATSLSQLEDNLGALDVVELLTPSVMEELDEILQTKPPPAANAVRKLTSC